MSPRFIISPKPTKGGLGRLFVARVRCYAGRYHASFLGQEHVTEQGKTFLIVLSAVAAALLFHHVRADLSTIRIVRPAAAVGVSTD